MMRWIIGGAAVLALVAWWAHGKRDEFWDWAEHQFDEGDRQ